MPSIPTEAYHYFDNKIYLPMLITVLERDVESFDKLPFKLNRPYLAVIDKALKYIRADLKAADIYLTRHNMRLVRNRLDEQYSEFVFIYAGHEERRKYTSDELRIKCEEILGTYFVK